MLVYFLFLWPIGGEVFLQVQQFEQSQLFTSHVKRWHVKMVTFSAVHVTLNMVIIHKKVLNL